MSYTGYRPLPQFALEALEQDTLDASEVSQTSERPALSGRRIRVRKRMESIVPPPVPSSEEVAVEDILLETYIEQPQRSMRSVSHSRADDHEVDALLMMTPSVAPVALRSIAPPTDAAPIKQSHGGFVAVALLVVAATTGFGAMLVAPHLRRPITPAIAPARAVTVIEAKTAQPEAVSVDALPPSSVEPTMTLVTFPSSAAGHRVYVDDTLIGSGEQRAKIRCGKHTIKIGSQGKPRDLDLPCGKELAY